MLEGRFYWMSVYSARVFQCLYSFFDFVAWVTFRWRDLESIQLETGRLFRLDAFNPALRSQRKKEEEKQEITQKESNTHRIRSVSLLVPEYCNYSIVLHFVIKLTSWVQWRTLNNMNWFLIQEVSAWASSIVPLLTYHDVHNAFHTRKGLPDLQPPQAAGR